MAASRLSSHPTTCGWAPGFLRGVPTRPHTTWGTWKGSSRLRLQGGGLSSRGTCRVTLQLTRAAAVTLMSPSPRGCRLARGREGSPV